MVCILTKSCLIYQCSRGGITLFLLSKLTIDIYIYIAQPRDKISFYQHREHPDPDIHVNPIVELGQTALHIAMAG